MYRSILFSTAALALVAGTISAHAACGVPRGAQFTQIKLPPLKAPSRPSPATIVGTWQTALSINDEVILRTLIQWHDDGTESDNADLPPTLGNTCEGSWVSTGPRKVHRYHLGWTFDANSNPSGMFVLTEDNKVAKNGNTYSGTFDQKFYDNDGNLVNEIEGTVAATRVTAD
jgi:hypothetical protein